MRFKKLLKQYGVFFGGVYILVFFLLVTFYDMYEFPTYPGDVLLKLGGLKLYLPFATSAVMAILAVGIREGYIFFKRF